MRSLLLALLFAFSLPVVAEAAAPNWLDDLFVAPHRTVQHRTVRKPAAKPAKPTSAHPAATPVTPAPAPDAAVKAAASPSDAAGPAAGTPAVTPLPRPRPAEAETPPPPPAGANPPPPPAGANPPPSPAAGTTPPSGPQSVGGSVEGETATPKPPRVYQTACPAVIDGLVEATPLPPLADGQCQEQSPLSVTAMLVNGRMLKLSAPATFNCGMATQLPDWVAAVDNYLAAADKTRIKSVLVGDSYQCRDRNVAGGSADLSEHGRADALDFVGFTLEDGRQVTVTADYGSTDPKISRLMHFAHDAACTRFTTVLGPDANALHHDHFHLDLGCHGKTCTFRLCE